MFPQTKTFDIWGRHFEVGLYSGCILVAAAIVLWGGMWALRGFPRIRTAPVLLAALLFGFVGARALNLLVNGAAPFSWDRLCDVRCSHFSLYGALFAGGVAAALGARVAGLPLGRLADAMTVPVAAAIAVARLGCFCRGCCFGLACDEPWGVTFPPLSPAHLFQVAAEPLTLLCGPAPVHPTQLYEMGAAACAALAAWACRRRDPPPGTAFLAATICFTSLRWLNLLFRAPVYATPAMAWFYPMLYPTILIASAFLLARGLRATPARLPDLTGEKRGEVPARSQ